MQNILMIVFSDIKNDPRVYRHICFLKDKYNITAIGYENPEIEGVDFIKVKINTESMLDKVRRAILLKLGKFDEYYWSKYDFSEVFDKLKNKKFDLIIANDIDTLPLALEIKNNAKILFDAHEYFPREFEENLYWRFFFQKYKTYLCEKYIPLADSMITVGHIIAKEYHKNFRMLPEVITNASDFHSNLHPTDNCDTGKIKLVHCGYAFESRKIELMIETFSLLDEAYELYLYLKPLSKKYYEKLKKLANKCKNVFILDPVPNSEIIRVINKYDLGFYILPSNNFNNLNALPNKIFEFVQARLGIVSGPSPEIANLIKKYSLGVVTEDFTPESAAKAISSLTYNDVMNFKNNAHKYAYELSSEKNKEKYLEIVKNLIG